MYQASIKSMASLGDFVFEMASASFDTLKRTSRYRWTTVNRIGKKPANQWNGSGLERIRLKGIIFPHFSGGLAQINKLREMANEGKPYRLVYTDSKKAESQGLWVIKRINETRSVFISAGAPLKIEFSVDLEEYGDDSV